MATLHISRRARASCAYLVGVVSVTSMKKNNYAFCATANSTNDGPTSTDLIGEMTGKLNATLPGPREASKLSVHRFKALVTKEEIAEILEFESKHRFSLGSTRRDNVGIRKLNSEWVTSYLHTDNLFQRRFPALMERLINAAYEADRLEHWNLIHASTELQKLSDGEKQGDASSLSPLSSPSSSSSSSSSSSGMSSSSSVELELEQEKKRHVGVRVIELHRVSKGGGLCDVRHHDTGSIMTVDLMLTDGRGGDFTGGQFSTGDGDADSPVQIHEFEQGDVVVFPSHKYHFVQPVKSGQRMVLVMELWYGQDRGCAHRCLSPSHLPCSYSVTESVCENILKAASPDVDPW